MELLSSLKYSYQRSQTISIVLINIFEFSYASILIASTFNVFYKHVFEIIVFEGPFNDIITIGLCIYNLSITLIALLGSISSKFAKLKNLWPLIALLFKLHPYLFFVSLANYELGSAINGTTLLGKLLSIINISFFVGYQLLHQFLNQSLKFRQNDFCNKRLVSYPEQLIIIMGIIAVKVMGSLQGSLLYLLRAVFVIGKHRNSLEFKMLHRIQLFHALFYGYIAIITIMSSFNLVDPKAIAPVPNSLFLFVAGALMSRILSKQLAVHFEQNILAKTQLGGERVEGEQANDKQQSQLQNVENQLKGLVQVLLERQRHLQGKDNQYENYWKIFNERVFIHKLKCQQIHCICKNKKKIPQVEIESEIYIHDLLKRVEGVGSLLGKEGRLKVININILLQIAKRPLKGYFELISLKKQKNKLALILEMEDIVRKARDCFDQIYYKNKVQNQQLDLLKVIECEEIMNSLEQQLRLALIQTSAFLQIFTYSTVKMTQVENESFKLCELKKSIESKFEKVVWEMGQNGNIGLDLFIFYRMLEVYRSRQNEFKKLGGQQLLKKRLLQKAEGEMVAEQQGIIYIDLVQERGRIKKITKNISEFFGYTREDMVGFNINLFMPTHFGKYHARFLSNFIDKGRIKLLKEKIRVVFGKNKQKYIFPINIKLKTQHLQHDQFGASAVIGKLETSSEYIISSSYGKIQEITEGLYNRIFGKILRQQVTKISRLCIYKMIMSLNQIIDNWQQNLSNKIYEGLLIYTDADDYLFEKFRFSRENTYSTFSNKTKSLSMSSITSSSLNIESRSERLEYFAQLFKSFLIDINPSKLRGCKINFKYSKVKTSEFSVQLIQIVSIREELEGKQFLRELLNQLNNVAEIYQLMEEHSPLERHLAELQASIEKLPTRKLSLNGGIKIAGNSNINDKNYKEKQFSMGVKQSQVSYEEQQQQQKRLFNPQNSQQSSLIGNTESESKKQLLINAFNSTESAISPTAVTIAYIILTILSILLGLLTYFSYTHALQIQSLWNQSSFILNIKTTMEFRLAIIELQLFAQNVNFTLPSGLQSNKLDLNNYMINLMQQFNTMTGSSGSWSNSPYTYSVYLYDPNRNFTYLNSLPQALYQLLHLYQQSSPQNIQFLRYNYETIHLSLKNFYSQRQQQLQTMNTKSRQIISYIFGSYTGLLIIVALCSLPLYIYFKREEFTIKGKLAFMNLKEIKKSINKLKFTLEFMKYNIKKGAVTRLQAELSQKKGEKDEETVNATRSIKITSQTEETKVFKNPWLYILLLAFIGFFSNLSVSLYVLSENSAGYYANVISANELVNNLQIKSPLLLNVYLSNINRALSGSQQWNFTQATIQESIHGYFDLINTISSTSYNGNSIAQTVQLQSIESLCMQINCNVTTMSLGFLANSYRNRFDYWNPTNGITPNNATVAVWISDNNIYSFIVQLQHILSLTQIIRNNIQGQFDRYLAYQQMLIVILASILIPINMVGLIFICKKFLAELNGIIKTAEQIFMCFPVAVLVENTYLTSYFNSKAKHGK